MLKKSSFRKRNNVDFEQQVSSKDIAFVSDYIGSDTISEIITSDIFKTLSKIFCDSKRSTTSVVITFSNTSVVVKLKENGTLIIKAPLYAITLFSQENLSDIGNALCLIVTENKNHICHCFHTDYDKTELHDTTKKWLCKVKSTGLKLKTCSVPKSGFVGLQSTTAETKSSEHSSNAEEIVKNEGSLQEICPKVSIKTLPTGLNRYVKSFQSAIQAVKSCDVGILLNCIDEDILILNAVDEYSFSLLHFAVESSDIKVVHALLEKGIDVNIKGPNAQTALHFSVLLENYELGVILIDNGADVNVKDVFGQTPLHLCANSLTKFQLLLIKEGACVEVPNIKGIRPTDINNKLKEIQSSLLYKIIEAFTNLDMLHVTGNNNQVKTDEVLSSHLVSQSSLSADNLRRCTSRNCTLDSLIENKIDYSKERIHSKDSFGKTELLSILLKLSANRECNFILITELCKPKFVVNLQLLAFSADKSNVEWVSKFLLNLFNVNTGWDPRKHRLLMSTIFKTIMDLLDSEEPLLTTCLFILNSIISKDHDGYSASIECDNQISILANLLDPGKNFHQTSSMKDTNHPPTSNTNNHPPTSLFSNEFNPIKQSSCSLHQLVSYFSGCSISNAALQLDSSISVRLQAKEFLTQNLVMKLLAASSYKSKFINQFIKENIFNILLNNLLDHDQDVVLHCLVVVVNIAKNFKVQEYMKKMGVEASLLKLQNSFSIQVQYQVIKALVYLGHVDADKGYLYKFLLDKEISPSVVLNNDSLGGCSVEGLILDLTKGNHSHNYVNDSKESANFLIRMFKTFLHPVIFMRLLLHRFQHPDIYKSFINNNLTQDGSIMGANDPLPILHIHLMRIWITWLETIPEDFNSQPNLKNELWHLVSSMKVVGGPYIPCAKHLEFLLDSCSLEKPFKIPSDQQLHDSLFDELKNKILDGTLPCHKNDFVYLAGIQLYVEDLCKYGCDFPLRLNTINSLNYKRLKYSLGKRAVSMKKLVGKIRFNYERCMFLRTSIRNAKHNYIDLCQALPSYGCKFYQIKKCSLSQMKVNLVLGLNAKQFVILDTSSKLCLKQFNLTDLYQWFPYVESSTLKLKFRNVSSCIEFVLENREMLKEISIQIFKYLITTFGNLSNFDSNPWGKFAEVCGTWDASALEAFMTEVNDFLQFSSSFHNSSTNDSTKLFNLTNTASLVYGYNGENIENHFKDSKIYVNCCCPPDPDIKDLNLKDFSAFELLQHPQELARQITLIDHELFSKLSTDDLLRKIGVGCINEYSNKKELSIEKVVRRINELSNWVSNCIVSEINIQRRVHLYVNFIQTAVHCFQLCNYSAVVAIVVGGLGHTSVLRLKSTLEYIPWDHINRMKQLQKLMNPKRNYSHYRKQLRFTSTSSTVPYLGVYMRDLTFLKDGNPDFLKRDILNLFKIVKINSILAEISSYQQKAYNLKKINEIQDYLLGRPILTCDELIKLSERIEPSFGDKSAVLLKKIPCVL